MLFSLALLPYPSIDPVLIAIGPVVIRWYALAYIAGIFLGYLYMLRLNRSKGPLTLSKRVLDDLMLWAILGIMLGGRLGYVLFYQTGYYVANPEQILAIWRGGMSFHGGLIGVIVAFYMYARRRRMAYLPLMDMVACAAPIGLFFGRLANFINGELYGRATDVSWAMIFPRGGDVPRHPSQLYEAGLEGLVLFVLLAGLAWGAGLRQRAGFLSGVFLAGYGASRAFVEYFREPDEQLGFIIGSATMGQLLCVPMIALGLYLMLRAKKVSA